LGDHLRNTLWLESIDELWDYSAKSGGEGGSPVFSDTVGDIGGIYWPNNGTALEFADSLL
jgi:hypothetical protein